MKTLSLWKDQEGRLTLDEAIAETINGFYKIDAWQYDVWEIGYSGGKDSTALVTLLAYLMASGQLPRPKRVIVQYSDTGMELPPLRSSALQLYSRNLTDWCVLPREWCAHRCWDSPWWSSGNEYRSRWWRRGPGGGRQARRPPGGLSPGPSP